MVRINRERQQLVDLWWLGIVVTTEALSNTDDDRSQSSCAYRVDVGHPLVTITSQPDDLIDGFCRETQKLFLAQLTACRGCFELGIDIE